MQPKANIVDLPVYQPGKPIEEVKKELGLKEVIKLASNENPFGFSDKAKAALLADLDNLSLYPDGASVELIDVLAKKLHVNDDQLIFGAGSDEVILMITRAFLRPGDETVMASHTFPQYKHNALVEGATCIEVPLRDGTHDLSAMLAKINDKTRIVWLCNPNNPTGTMVSHNEVLTFINQVPSSVMIVLDEAYVEYIDTPDFPNSLQLLNQYPNIVILRTFSKIYGLAALRIGYGIGRAETIRSINQVREPFNTGRLAQAAAKAALLDDEFISHCRTQNRIGIDYMCSEFNVLDLPFFPAYGNFVMVDVKKPAEAVFNGLLRRGIIVRGGHKLDFPTHIRVTVGSQQQNEAFIKALREVLAE
jgi:histidinol-phosphate aminotransferase